MKQQMRLPSIPLFVAWLLFSFSSLTLDSTAVLNHHQFRDTSLFLKAQKTPNKLITEKFSCRSLVQINASHKLNDEQRDHPHLQRTLLLFMYYTY